MQVIIVVVDALFLSTLSLRRATDGALLSSHVSLISIHALLAESDSKPKDLKSRRMTFLSTLSLRRATSDSLTDDVPTGDFYPRSPCGERPMGLDGRFKL